MFPRIATRLVIVLAAFLSVVIALRLIVAMLTPIVGQSLMSYVLAGASMLWNFITPGLAALAALALLGGIWWLLSGRHHR